MVDTPLNVVGGGGSPVIDLEVGGAYQLADRPGLYELVQFETCDDVRVREVGIGTLIDVPARNLRSLVSSENTRTRDLLVLESERIANAEVLLKAIQPLLIHKRIPSKVLEERAKEVSKAPKTLMKWIRRYRKDPRLSSLTRKQRADAGGTRFDPQIEKELKKAIQSLLDDANLTIREAYRDMCDSLKDLAKQLRWKKWKRPSYGTFYNRFQLISEKQKAEARLGKRPAHLLHGLKPGGLTDCNHPLAIVQVDHLELPVIVVDEETRTPIGKGWITVLIDTFSRCITGYYITLESPSNLSLGLAMVHAILPKDDSIAKLESRSSWPISGFMWSVHADNAGEFHGNMLELAANEYVIDLMFRKVKLPNYGGHIESYLGTLSEQLRRLPGSKRESPEALGDTDPNESAAMTLDELEKYILSLIATYHNTPHSGLNGMTPLARFAEGMRGGKGILPVGKLRQAVDPEKLKIDFLPCTEVCVHSKGIVWDYIWYANDCLQRWVNAIDLDNRSEKRKFLVRRDPRDLSQIYFWDPEEKRYRIIGTRNMSRPRITLWEYKATRAFLRARGVEDIDEDMLFAAREQRRQLAAKAVAKTKAAKSKRAREAERERRARDAIDAERKSGRDNGLQSPAAPSPEAKPTDSNSASTAVRPYVMDWGDS